MSLPSARDINPYDTLDGISAQQHFLDNTLDDAVRLFEDNFLYYHEDLMFMGPIAFCFYFPAAIQYAESPGFAIEFEIAYLMLTLMRYRWECDRAEIQNVRDAMLQYCQGVLERIPQMDPDYWNWFGNLEERFKSFIDELNAK